MTVGPILNNLAELPEYQLVLQDLRQAHLDWMKETKDTAFIPEGQLRKWATQYGNEYSVVDGGGNNAMDRWIAAVQLSEQGPDSIPAMVTNLDDSDPVVRYWATMGLGHQGTVAQSAEQKLLVLLDDPSGDVRVAAARALTLMDKPPQALDAFRALIQHQRKEVRLHALNVIELLGYRCQPLVPDLQNRLNDEQYDKARKALESAIETIPQASTPKSRYTRSTWRHNKNHRADDGRWYT
ncbi:MAG: hypothetical protein GF401_05030 [Chitinivibrionales bacterium]|nr:hypothetical protein [Chitinivibrionales bacterium]